MKIFILLVLICINSYAGNSNDYSIEEPEEPSIPVIHWSSNKTQDNIYKTQNGEKEENINLFVYDVRTVFQDNTILKGIVSFPENSIKIKHKKKGFVFEKTVFWEDVKSIKILEWGPRKGPKNKETKTQMFHFYPLKYKIIMKKGKVYHYNKNITYLNKLVLTNEDGSTYIFSFFVDYWKETGEKAGYWQNARSTYFYAPVKNPLKKALKVINFK